MNVATATSARAARLPGTRVPDRSARLAALRTWLSYGIVVVILAIGWQLSGRQYLNAESGIGYALGIIGGSSMLLLAIYPLRKRMRRLQHLGAVKHWFRVHIFLGVVGPVLVLFHANFSLGSTNSTVALFSMLLVAASGLVGRYLYEHIHHDLNGRRIELAEIRSRAAGHLARWRTLVDLAARARAGAPNGLGAKARPQLLALARLAEELGPEIEALESGIARPRGGVLGQLIRARLLARRLRRLRRKSRRTHRRVISEAGLSDTMAKRSRALVEQYLAAAHQTEVIALYEGLFSWWHILHLPMFLMLIVTGVIHVVAVHLY